MADGPAGEGPAGFGRAGGGRRDDECSTSWWRWTGPTERRRRAQAPSVGGVSFEARELPRRPKEADLLFAFVLSDGKPELALTCNSEIFRAQRARGLLEGLCPILDAMADNRPVARILDREGTPYE
ncbi:hypothetical protein HFP72_30530 [Nocardiopsis sp. ARC36]